MRSDQGRNTFQGIAAVSRFVTNLLPFRQRQGVRDRWFLINNVEERGLVGQRFRRASTPLERGGMSFVYLAVPPFLLSRDAPAAPRRMGHQEAESKVQPAGPLPFNAPGRQSPLRRPPAWPAPDERRPLDRYPTRFRSSFVTNLLPFRQRQGVSSGWFLINNVEERGFLGQRFWPASTP